MSQPTKSAVHIDRPLTNMSVAYIQSQQNFIANQVFPRVPVMKSSDKYFTYPKGFFFTDEMQLRAPATESKGTGYGIGTDSYSTDTWALHHDIADEIRDNQDQPLNADRDAMQFLTQKGFIRQEKIFSEKYFTTGIWTGSESGGDVDLVAAKWSVDTSTPILDVDNQKEAMREKTGIEPNKLVVSSKVHKALKNHPEIIDRVKHTQLGVVTHELLAQMFEIDQYIVAKATHNTANEGATAAMSFILGDYALLCYAPQTPSIMTPSAGYIFPWVGHIAASEYGHKFFKFRMDHLKADRLEIEMAFDMKQVAADLGCMFKNVI